MKGVLKILENDQIFKKLKIGNIWLFITEKCNLNCDYCFFKREGKKNLKFSQALSLLRMLPANKNYDFVISGGEPLLCWNFVKDLIEYVRIYHSESKITLQTNLYFLSVQKIKFLKENNVIIEPGIDGGFLTNFRHRKSLDRESFNKCIKNLELLIKYKLTLTPTMTVHPQETKYMFNNFRELVSLGLSAIEVHPAFLAEWKEKEASEFIKQYVRILEYEKNEHKYLVCKDYSFKIDFFLDLVIRPDGFVLPNWTYLPFPYELQKDFFIMKLTNKEIYIFEKNLKEYLEKIKFFFKEKKSYREFSNFNAGLILNKSKDAHLEKRFKVYQNLCEEIQKLDLFFCKNNGSKI